MASEHYRNRLTLNICPAEGLDQSFTYALNGNILSNSKLGSYSYGPPTLPRPDAPLIAGPRTYTGACPRA